MRDCMRGCVFVYVGVCGVCACVCACVRAWACVRVCLGNCTPEFLDFIKDPSKNLLYSCYLGLSQLI